MKLNKKILSGFIVMNAIALVCTIPVFADKYKSNSTTAKDEGHSRFKKVWKDYVCLEVDGEYYEFTIGYDTWWVKEDYIKDVFAQEDNDKTYYGKVENSVGDKDTTNRKSDTSKTGKADIKHTGTDVTYYVYAR